MAGGAEDAAVFEGERREVNKGGFEAGGGGAVGLQGGQVRGKQGALCGGFL